jgi:hypothetical protein
MTKGSALQWPVSWCFGLSSGHTVVNATCQTELVVVTGPHEGAAGQRICGGVDEIKYLIAGSL